MGLEKRRVRQRWGMEEEKVGKDILIGEHWVCNVATPNGNFLKSVRVTLVRTPVTEDVESE